ASAESDDLYLLTLAEAKTVDRLLPQDRSAAWRNLDYAIANHVILQRVLGLEESQMSDYNTLWFTEDAAEAVRDVRGGRARFALLMNPVPATRVLDLAFAGAATIACGGGGDDGQPSSTSSGPAGAIITSGASSSASPSEDPAEAALAAAMELIEGVSEADCTTNNPEEKECVSIDLNS